MFSILSINPFLALDVSVKARMECSAVRIVDKLVLMSDLALLVSSACSSFAFRGADNTSNDSSAEEMSVGRVPALSIVKIPLSCSSERHVVVSAVIGSFRLSPLDDFLFKNSLSR